MDLSRAQQVMVGVALAGILAGTGMLWYARQRSAAPISAEEFFREAPRLGAEADQSPSNVKVFVSGAVAQPGELTVPAGSTVRDVLARAGGVLPNANLAALRSEVRVRDGDTVFVPRNESIPSLPRQEAPTPEPEGRNSVKQPPERRVEIATVNINTADAAELEKLPGIGPTLAGRIVSYRLQHGPYMRPDDLLRIHGIGPKKLQELQPYVTVR